MIKEYKTIPRTVEAVQFLGTPENYEDIIELTTEEEDSVDNAFMSGAIRADIGEWIIKKDQGDYEVMTDEEFQLNYRQV